MALGLTDILLDQSGTAVAGSSCRAGFSPAGTGDPADTYSITYRYKNGTDRFHAVLERPAGVGNLLLDFG